MTLSILWRPYHVKLATGGSPTEILQNEVYRMKKLNMFLQFDWDGFAKDKSFQVTDLKPLRDREHNETILGTVVELVILKDETDYQAKPGEVVSNLYEKFRVKVPQISIDVRVGDFVELVNPVATVFGDYRNQLSVKADDILVLDE